MRPETRMDQAAFEQCIVDAVGTVPERIRKAMNNVVFVVENGSRPPSTGEVRIQRGQVLLGLYQGVPLTRRGPQYSLVPPDKITIFQDVIEHIARGDPERIRAVVSDTVHHEIAHHLGFSEREVRVWEQKRRQRRLSPHT